VKYALPQETGLFATATCTDSHGAPVAEIVPLILPGDDGDWEVAWGDVRWVFDFQAALAGASGTGGMISWLAVRRMDDEVVNSAICRAPVLFDADTGAVTGLDLTSVERFPVSSSDFDWSPDGGQSRPNRRAAGTMADRSCRRGRMAASPQAKPDYTRPFRKTGSGTSWRVMRTGP
jgi:hypothetical protein